MELERTDAEGWTDEQIAWRQMGTQPGDPDSYAKQKKAGDVHVKCWHQM